MTRIHLAQGIARDNGRILLVASRYPSHEQPLWNLPGGRQEPGELLWQTAVREIYEETGLQAAISGLAYVNESYDGDTHFLSTVFEVEVAGTLCVPQDEHVSDVRWVRIDEAEGLIVADVVRQPLLAYLRGELAQRYAARLNAGISVRWSS